MDEPRARNWQGIDGGPGRLVEKLQNRVREGPRRCLPASRQAVALGVADYRRTQTGKKKKKHPRLNTPYVRVESPAPRTNQKPAVKMRGDAGRSTGTGHSTDSHRVIGLIEGTRQSTYLRLGYPKLGRSHKKRMI